ncbi:GNAT family N-acetyltransferase [Streptomyces sp. NPDC002324]
MRFRWDWLRPVVTVPFVPTLGPVHPSVLTVDLFADTLIAASAERRFLHYDKDIRWSDAKAEKVLVEGIVHEPGETLIPTLLRRGAGTVKVHLYGTRSNGLLRASDLAQKLSAECGIRNAKIVQFIGPEAVRGQGVRVQLKDFREPCPEPDGRVLTFDEWPADTRDTFAEFSSTMAGDGFAFLYDQMRAGNVGPVLVASVNGCVAGAIGPMEIRRDAVGSAQLMPQYFGVLPKHRGRGIGRHLWRAAMQWGQRNGAHYQLLQTEVGGASDRLCRSEGLRSLGFVYSTALTV